MGVAFTRKRVDEFSTLRQGLVGAWCPSLPNGGSGNMLPDLIGGNHGTLTNMDASDWVSSGEGRALDFDGVNDAVSFGDPDTLDFASPFSLSIWVNVNVLPSTAGGAIVSKWNTSFRQFVLNIRSSSGTFPSTVEFETGSGSSDGGCRSMQAIIAGTWTNLIGIYDGTNCKLYWNGISEASATTVQPTSTSRVIYLARRDDAANPNWLNAKIDDVRFYNRALSDSEIKLLASKRGIGLEPRQPDITYYPFPSGSRRRRLLTGMP